MAPLISLTVDERTATVIQQAWTTGSAVMTGMWDIAVSHCGGACLPNRAAADAAGEKLVEDFAGDDARYEVLPALVPNGLTFEADPDRLCGVVELYMRIGLGQWDRIGEWVGWDWGRAVLLDAVRAEFAVGALKHPSTSLSIGGAPDRYRRAYNLWHRLGGGIHDRGDMPVDGPFLAEIEELTGGPR